MGWPSIENELDAWSPNPWKRPFESAETPGEAKVTSELSDEDGLSRGTLSNKARSTSVCVVGSFSTKSPPFASTVTVVAVPLTFKLTSAFAGTADRTSTSSVELANPAALTTVWYVLNGTFVKRKDPSLPVVVVRL